MSTIQRVAIFGAGGNFGTPITKALVSAGFDVTAISRLESTASFPPGLSVVRVAYTVDALTKALSGQDAVVCVVGPGAIHLQEVMVDAAEAAGVKRSILDDFAWGKNGVRFPELAQVHDIRVAGWDHAMTRATANSEFTWTAISTGNPIDWGIGESVLGVLLHPEETRNRFVRIMSIKTCQNELLEAFEAVTGAKWEVQRATTKALLENGRRLHSAGQGAWRLHFAVTQLLQEGQPSGQVAPSRDQSESDLVGVTAESPGDIVARVIS